MAKCYLGELFYGELLNGEMSYGEMLYGKMLVSRFRTSTPISKYIKDQGSYLLAYLGPGLLSP